MSTIKAIAFRKLQMNMGGPRSLTRPVIRSETMLVPDQDGDT